MLTFYYENILLFGRKKGLALTADMRAQIQRPEFVASHRRRPQDFSRKRELTFPRVLLFVLQKGVKGLQNRLAEFYEGLERLALPEHESSAGQGWAVTKGALSQARIKLAHTAFIALNEQAVLPNGYAPAHPESVARWRGHRLCAIDGSLVRLPASKALGEHFGWSESGNEKGPCGPRHVQARASVYFDLLNRLGLDARLEPFATGERTLAVLHTCAMQAGDVVLLDRGYCGVEGFLTLLAAGVDFIARVPRNWVPAARALFAANRAGVSVVVALGDGALRVRLVTVRLSTGELEVLATSLLDETLYPSEAFGEVYHLRWGVETYYHVLKDRLEIERWSGESLEAVRQDFFSSVLLTNVESVLSEPAQAHLSATDRQRKQALQVNRAQSFHAIKSHALELFFSSLPAEELLERLTRLMRASPVAKRPGRKVPRKPTPARASLAHLRYKRKHVF